MPMIVMHNGKYVQSDGARHDGKGFGQAATLVQESSVVLPRVDILAARQAEQMAIDTAEINRKKNVKIRKINRAAMKAHLDALRRTEVAANSKPMGGPNDRISKQDQLIKRELMRQMAGRGDFNSFEQMADTKDFGSNAADFQTYSVRGNPLTPDGSYGAVTDFERVVQGRPFSSPYGDIPLGLQRSQGNRATNPMGSLFSDWTGINIDAGDPNSEAGQLVQRTEDYVAAHPQETIKTLTQAGQQIGLIPQPTVAARVTSAIKAPLAAIQKQLSGTVKVPGLGNVKKTYLAVGLLALVAAGGTFYVMKRKKG